MTADARIGEPEEPVVGAAYHRVPPGQGIGVVVRLDQAQDGTWARVLIEYAAGCMPMPPEGRPDAPMEEWELPVGEVWVDRREWESWGVEPDGGPALIHQVPVRSHRAGTQ